MQELQMKSQGREEPPTWDENWCLIRRLWPDWKPTEEQIREIWFQTFDKPHGARGEKRVNHDALREAIKATARSKKWSHPIFVDIADAYRHERSKTLAEIDSLRTDSARTNEAVELQDERTRLEDEIRKWPSIRLMRARQRLEDQWPTFKGKSTDFTTWSRLYLGCVINADKEIGGADALDT